MRNDCQHERGYAPKRTDTCDPTECKAGLDQYDLGNHESGEGSLPVVSGEHKHGRPDRAYAAADRGREMQDYFDPG